jgi:hypothetical protein
MKKILTLAVLAFATILAGCGSKEVSLDTLEEQKVIARDNSVFNAQRYKANHPVFSSYSIVPNGDSSQTRQCPQGDGWATLELFKDGKQTQKIKCSTYSAATACLTDEDFKTKPFADEDKRCNQDLTLKRIATS